MRMKRMFLQIIACFITTCSFSQTVSKTDTSSRKLRSVATFINPLPIYVIDGVISTANNIDPSTIATIVILKEAEATAIYGAAGVGGVTIITTNDKKSAKKQ
jgi:hypothetical protein